MTPRAILERALTETLKDDDGKPVRLEMAPPLSAHEIRTLESKLGVPLPAEIRDLVEHCRAFALVSPWTRERFLSSGLFKEVGLEVRFDQGLEGQFMEEAFPLGFPVTTDLCGNSWVVDVEPGGRWGAVFFACHDPPVIAFQSRDLASFLIDILLRFTPGQMRPLIDADLEGYVPVDLQKAGGLRQSPDASLRAFAQTLGDDDGIADLRPGRPGSGFEWDLHGPETNIRRFGSEWLFALRAPERKRGFLARLFGK